MQVDVCLTRCENHDEIDEAIKELYPAICERRKALTQDRPVKAYSSSKLTAREEFNKILNSCTHPRFVYNVLAALVVAEMMEDAYDKH